MTTQKVGDKSCSSNVDPLLAFAHAHNSICPETAMRELCARLRARCGFIEPPFGLRTIGSLLRARVERRLHLGRLRGALERREDGYTIKLDAAQSWRRARFTLAHELGHILLLESLAHDPAAVQALRDIAYWPAVEALCDLAAMELLVPINDLKERLFPGTLDALDSLCLVNLYDRYLVSYPVLFKRLLEIDINAVVLWRRRQETDGKLRWRVSAVYRHGPGFIPPNISAERHLRPDPFIQLESMADDGWSIGCPDLVIQVRKHEWRGRALMFSSTRRHKPPVFEGFDVPDERGFQFDAVMVLQLREPS